MYTEVSDNYKTTINGYSRRFTARMKKDGEIINAEIKSYSLGKYSSTGEDFCLGCAFSSSVTISCVTDVPLKDREITLETGLYIGSEVEYVPDGAYTITAEKKKDLVTELNGYDRMYTAGQNTFQVPELPVMLSAAATAVAEQLGCEFDSACLAGIEDITLETMPAGTLSEMAGYLAGLIGRNAYIDRSGKLTFKGYADSGYTFDGNRISDMNADSSSRTINWLECTVGDGEENILQSGTGSGYARMQNPMMTQAILDSITAGIAGFSYYGAEVPFLLGDSRLDPWDIIHYQYLATGDALLTDENSYILTDEFGNTFVDLISDSHQISVCCHEITWKFDGGLSMDINSYALSESEENTNFRGPMQAAVDQANQAAAEAKKEVGDLDKRLTQKEIFNRLTNNGEAQGVYYDESTGELYINATYIVSGILSSLGGESWINLENGKFKLTNGFLESIKIKDDIRISSSEDSDGFVAIRLNKRARGFDIIFLPEDGGDGACAIFKGITSFDMDAIFNDAAIHRAGSYVHTAKGSNGSAGYVLIARINVSENYHGSPMILHLLQTGMEETVLQIRFTSDTEPEIYDFTHRGGQAAYLIKSESSIWDLYIKKMQDSGNICVSQYYQTPGGITVSWMDEQASDLPEGYLTSTPSGITWIIVDNTKDLSSIPLSENCVVYFKKGTYNADDQINLSGIANVTFLLYEAIISSSKEYFIIAENCDDIKIFGGKATDATKCAVKLQNCRRPVIRHLEVADVGNSGSKDTAGIQLFGDCTGFDVSDCYIHDVSSEVMSSDGFIHAYGVFVNRLGSTNTYSRTGKISNLEVSNIAGIDNTDVKADGDGIFIQAPPYLNEDGSVNWRDDINITIENCNINDCKKRGIKLAAVGVKVRNTYVDGEMWYAGIDCQYGHADIDGCTVINKSDYNGSITSAIVASEGGVRVRKSTIKAPYSEYTYHPGIRFNKRLPASVVPDTVPWDDIYIEDCYFDKVSRAVYGYVSDETAPVPAKGIHIKNCRIGDFNQARAVEISNTMFSSIEAFELVDFRFDYGANRTEVKEKNAEFKYPVGISLNPTIAFDLYSRHWTNEPMSGYDGLPTSPHARIVYAGEGMGNIYYKEYTGHGSHSYGNRNPNTITSTLSKQLLYNSKVGDMYTDTTAGKVYICTAAGTSDSIGTWTLLGG